MVSQTQNVNHLIHTWALAIKISWGWSLGIGISEREPQSSLAWEVIQPLPEVFKIWVH